MQFADKTVPYSIFINDLSREIVAKTIFALRVPNDIVSQNFAYKMCGPGNVRRWLKQGKLKPLSKRPGKIEFSVFDLQRLQEREQDYFCDNLQINNPIKKNIK